MGWFSVFSDLFGHQSGFLNGSGQGNILTGASTDDFIVGGRGGDILTGMGGNDLIIGGGFDDGPTDQLLASYGENPNDHFLDAPIYDGDDILTGGHGNDTLIGGGWQDGLVDDNGRFDLGEQVVTETTASGTNANVIAGEWGHDLAVGGNDSDVIDGGYGNDKIYGLGGIDVLLGDYGQDVLDAGAGDDVLVGGKGDDTMTGGDGADTFSFHQKNGDDVITDFNVADDVLHLSHVAGLETRSTVLQAARDTVVDGIEGVLIESSVDGSVFLTGISAAELSSASINFE